MSFLSLQASSDCRCTLSAKQKVVQPAAGAGFFRHRVSRVGGAKCIWQHFSGGCTAVSFRCCGTSRKGAAKPSLICCSVGRVSCWFSAGTSLESALSRISLPDERTPPPLPVFTGQGRQPLVRSCLSRVHFFQEFFQPIALLGDAAKFSSRVHAVTGMGQLTKRCREVVSNLLR